MNKNKIDNFIVCIFLFISLISVIGVGLEAPHSFSLTKDSGDGMQCFVEAELLFDDNVTNIRLVEKSSNLIQVWHMRTVRSVFSYRKALYFLCALAFLSELFVFSNRERFILYVNRHVSGICYQVVYMEDEDGRKRIS